MAGERPMILSASLRGPLDAKSGWINPWRYRPRKSSDATWWQPGSENMLFTRENVMQRAAAYGLGYMTPTEALAWCKASAQTEFESQYGTESRSSLLKSIECDEPEDPDNSEDGETAEQPGDSEGALDDNMLEAQIGEQFLIVDNNITTPYASKDQGGGTRLIKRPVNVDWLKGSYRSKRARWDGPALPSPTPVAPTNNHVEQRRRKVRATQVASLLPSEFRSIQNELLVPRDTQYQSSDSELDDFVTTPAKQQSTENPITRTPSSDRLSHTSSNNLPTLPRATAATRQQEAVDMEDSFVTEVAPSSRDLDKFIFKKKQRIHKSESFGAILDDHRQSDQYIDCTSRNAPLIAWADDEYSKNSPSPENEVSHVERNLDRAFIDEGRKYAKPDHSNVAQLNDQRTFQKLPYKSENAALKVAGNAVKYVIQKPMSKVGLGTVARKYPSSQDPNDISTQSYNSTPPCSRRSPTKLALPIGRTPKLARLLRFSFENTFGGSLFSPIAGVQEGYQEGIVNKMQSSVQASKRSQGETPIQYELDNYQLCVRGEVRNQGEENQDNPMGNNPKSPAKGDGIVVEGENSEDAMDQIQNSPSQKFPSISCESSTRSSSPQQIQEYPQADASYSVRNSIPGPAHVEKWPALISPDTEAQVEQHNIHMLDQEATLEDPSDDESGHGVTLVQAEPQEITTNEAKGTSEESSGSRCGKEATQPVAPQDIKRIDLKATRDKSAGIKGDQGATPSLRKHQDKSSLDSLLSHGQLADVGSGKEATARQATQVAQSPFGQETFLVDGLVLEANTLNQGFDTTVMSEDELEPGREGCGLQSPWVRDISDLLLPRSLSNAMDPQSPTRLLSDAGTLSAVPEGILIEKPGVEMEDYGTTFTEPPRTPEEDNFGIVPFKDLMSPSPALDSRTTYSNNPPANTQQLVEAALKNPWSSSFKKSSLIRARKRVSFNNLPPDDSEIADDSEGLGEVAASASPQEEELLNEHIFGGGFTRTAPFSNHFSAARTRMVTGMLPPTSQSPNNSSPHLSAQAEAFIAADSTALPDQGRSPNDFENPTRYLKPRSEINENSGWKEWGKQRSRLDDASPRSLLPRRQAYSPSMSDFNMEEALDQMDDFLEDWSVEAELKKAKEIAPTKETEDNGTRRRRLFGLA